MEIGMIIALLIVIAAGVLAIVLYYRAAGSENKRHEGAVNAGPEDTAPMRDKNANAAFVRKLRRAVAVRGLTLVQPDPDKTPFCAMIIGPHGVTAVYGADYTGTVYGSSDPSWAQVNDGVRRTFENPQISAENARRTLREVISQGKFRPFMVDARVVMTSPKAELAIPRNLPVYTVKSFNQYVENSADFDNDRKVDEQALKSFLEEHFC